MEEIAAFFKKTGLFYIATIEDGKPRVRPFGNLMILQGAFFINTGRKKRFYAQIQRNPYVEICAFDKGTWYRVEAKVTEVDDEKIKEQIMEGDPFVKKNYAQQMENLVALRLDEVKAYRCQFNNAQCVYEQKD